MPWGARYDDGRPERFFSETAQGGGSLVARDSGMGPGSTYSNEPVHLCFQFSTFVTNLMQSFYGADEPIVRVLERYRLKTAQAWKGGVHVDICGRRLLPPSVNAQEAERANRWARLPRHLQ